MWRAGPISHLALGYYNLSFNRALGETIQLAFVSTCLVFANAPQQPLRDFLARFLTSFANRAGEGGTMPNGRANRQWGLECRCTSGSSCIGMAALAKGPAEPTYRACTPQSARKYLTCQARQTRRQLCEEDDIRAAEAHTIL